MARREKREKKTNNKTIRKIFIVLIFLAMVYFILKYAPNYIKDDITNQTNLLINNSNVTNGLKQPVYINENGIIYISKEDIENYFDPYIYYDEKYNQIITGSDTKIAAIVIGENKITENGSQVEIDGTILEKDDTYYIPFSELSNVYNVEIKHIEETNTVVIDSLDRKLTLANSSKKNGIKYKPTVISKNVDTVERGEEITIVNAEEELPEGWLKVRTKLGKIGYVKEKDVTNVSSIREDMPDEPKVDGKVSMIWEYFSEYGSAPNRTGTKLKGVNVVSPTFFTLERLGKGDVYINVGEDGKNYISWAHENGYKVWPSISNNSMIDTTSEIMNDYKLREKLINKIVSYIIEYNLDGINIDFEYMYDEDKHLFSRFIIELAPRLNEIGAVLSVDVTAPDGGENWSSCYDRHTIGKVADYIVFMAYDQHGDSSEEAGTNAGADWVEVNLQKFVGTQEEISSDKVILGIPFYTRLWKQTSEGITNEAIYIKNISDVIPSNATKQWDDDLKQYVVEYEQNGAEYKVWLEEDESIKAKLELINKYKLAGAAYWTKDMEYESIWNIISEALQIK